MSPRLFSLFSAALVASVPASVSAQSAEKEAPAESEAAPAVKLKGWGEATDPSGTCEVKSAKDGAELTIKLPAGAEKSRNLCSELGNMTAPRVQQTMEGDFELQVKVHGSFDPSEDSLPHSRVPYLSGGLNIMADEKNYIRLERAVMRYPTPEPKHYINFEIRVDGELQRFGSNEKWPLDPEQPVYLRLEKSGDQVRGAVSADGKEWHWGEPKELTGTAWESGKVKAGVHAISSCTNDFTANFSELLCEGLAGGSKAPKKDESQKEGSAPAPAAEEKKK